MKIYLAGKWGDRALIRDIMKRLETEQKHTITHYWPECEDVEDTPRDLGECARLDIEGVRNAEVVIVLMTDPNYAYRGSFTEIGAALALGKPLYIVCHHEEAYCKTNCFFWHPNITHVESLRDVPGVY
jgi:nucleoside 2-deoxyribosyltransferase